MRQHSWTMIDDPPPDLIAKFRKIREQKVADEEARYEREVHIRHAISGAVMCLAQGDRSTAELIHPRQKIVFDVTTWPWWRRQPRTYKKTEVRYTSLAAWRLPGKDGERYRCWLGRNGKLYTSEPDGSDTPCEYDFKAETESQHDTDALLEQIRDCVEKYTGLCL